MLQNNKISAFLSERFKIYDEKNEIQTSVYKYLMDELLAGNDIHEHGYKYLCWLNFNNAYLYPIDINKPSVPVIINVTQDEFKIRFCYNNVRSEIYQHFCSYLKSRMDEFQVNNLNVLVGGSFVDASNDKPNDIDVVIVVSCEQMEKIITNEYKNYYLRDVLPVDVEFVKEESMYNDYWYYTCLTHIGNKPKDKKSERLKNNEFHTRNIFSINLFK